MEILLLHTWVSGESLIWFPPLVQRPDGANKPDFFCVAARNPDNSLVLAASGMSPFITSLGSWPPLLDFQEDEVAFPSVRVNLHLRRSVWC